MSGQPNESLRSQLTLETDGLSSFYEGNVRPAANVIDLEGRLDFKSRSAGLGLAAIGLDPSFAVSDKAVDLKLDVQKSGSDYTFKNIRGQWGKSEIGAEIAYAAGAKPARLQVEVQMTRANLASFTDFLQQNKSPTLLSSAQSLVNKSRSIWSDRPFSEPAFADLSGTLQLKATELGLLNGVNLQNAVLAADLTEGKVTVKQLQGRLFEGQFEASGTLKKILTGVRLDGQVNWDGWPWPWCRSVSPCWWEPWYSRCTGGPMYSWCWSSWRPGLHSAHRPGSCWAAWPVAKNRPWASAY